MANECQQEHQQPYTTSPPDWLNQIHTWYPELQKKTYFFPSVHINRFQCYQVTVANQEVIIPSQDETGQQALLPGPKIQDSDVRDDCANERILQCLHAVAEDSKLEEVMMVISQLKFGKYLGNPTYAAAASQFLRPGDLESYKGGIYKQYKVGDFDLLIINKHHGIIVAEVKSVGINADYLNLSDSEKNSKVVERLNKAITQLNKAKTVIEFILKDIPKVEITTLLVTPYINTEQLQTAICLDQTLQDLCACLGVDDPVQRCICSENLSSKDTGSLSHGTDAFKEWWRLFIKSVTKTTLSDNIYSELVARFCGPATTFDFPRLIGQSLPLGVPEKDEPKELRTDAQAVSAIGIWMRRLMLTKYQLDILDNSQPRVFLVGPPGTGKTVVLILQGLEWLKRGHDVYVVSTCNESRAASFAIEYQLQKMLNTVISGPVSNVPVIHREHYDLNIEEPSVYAAMLASLTEGRQLCCLVDEVGPDDDRFDGRHPFVEFCESLLELVSDETKLYLWAASLKDRHTPKSLSKIYCTTSLRSPPKVVDAVKTSEHIDMGDVPEYDSTKITIADRAIIPIRHADSQSGHAGIMIDDCEQCGRDIAKVLTDVCKTDVDGKNMRYLDVFVLCYNPHDDKEDINGHTSPASGIVRGLRECNIPIRVVEDGADDTVIQETAIPTSNAVTVTTWNTVRGLERDVIVVPERGMFGFDDDYKLHGMSRCSSQLVCITSDKSFFDLSPLTTMPPTTSPLTTSTPTTSPLPTSFLITSIPTMSPLTTSSATTSPLTTSTPTTSSLTTSTPTTSPLP